jgi:hypothetical protein
VVGVAAAEWAAFNDDSMPAISAAAAAIMSGTALTFDDMRVSVRQKFDITKDS